tara:strand:+ start:56644 stop:58059 length:1416 start_codon:yes stop_codon:yes gene_type:complete
MVQRLLIICILLTHAFLAHGFSVSVKGASSSSVPDSAAPSTLLVNGGYALPSNCATRDGSTTCDSCNGVNIEVASGTTAPAPCNNNSIYDELPLTIEVESDKTDITTYAVGVSKSSEYSTNPITTISLAAVNGRTYAFTATWAQLASAFELSFTCTATTGCGGLKTLYFGPIKDDKFVEYVTVKINFSIVNYSNLSTPYNGIIKGKATWCTPNSLDPLTSNISSNGLCYFEMFPGDQKAYITNFIAGWGASPVDPDTSLTYSNLTMFYAEKSASASVLDTLKSITNKSANSSVGLTTTVGDPLSSYKIEGLENGTADSSKTYCFLPALKDATGTYLYFLDFQANGITTDQFNNMCASPSEVVGILSDKDCFIATVAFGSRNHMFLDILREFRNKYLHPFSWGKKFIKFYYANGPGWAKRISENTLAKAVVKVTLLPVIAIAFLILNPLWLCVASGVGFLGYRRWKRRGSNK